MYSATQVNRAAGLRTRYLLNANWKPAAEKLTSVGLSLMLDVFLKAFLSKLGTESE